MKRKSVKRNPERTRELILAAALKEFSQSGFAGARVDLVARRSGVNKRMLYHYFHDKRGLFEEVLRRRMSERNRWAAVEPADPAELAPHWFAMAGQDMDWVRLLEWEALQVAPDGIIAEDQRRDFLQGVLQKIRDGQKKGLIARQYAAEHVLLSMMALTTFPLAFPQLTKMVTGLEVSDKRFHEVRMEFLRSFAAAFRPAGNAAPALGKSGRSKVRKSP